MHARSKGYAAISVYAAKLAEANPGEGVAVLGAGPIGLQAVQAAKAYGARQVVVIGGRSRRPELALELGPDAAIDRSSSVGVVERRFAAWSAEVLKVISYPQDV
ncbi:MAG: zinc-binding dehydrogenase [Anaerolineae bacterium]|nr:zinc-binding dehydrogenase [Anaerolineae bacterium]